MKTLAALLVATAACSSTTTPARRPPVTAARTVPTTTTTLPPTTVTPPATTARAARARRADPPEGNGGAMAQQLAAIKACESGGNYQAVSRSGRYRGAHQWSQETWNGVARRHRPDLVGRDPASASPADQDEMAGYLYAERGAQPWPTCG